MTRINLAFSPCPNDAFIFDPIINKRIDLEGFDFEFQLHDVETLNHMAMKNEPDMVKVSYYTYLLLQNSYSLLDSGSAMGQGNGPLLISRNAFTLVDIPLLTIAVPGEFTTAHLLLQIAALRPKEKKFMIFSEIENAVLSGAVDAGVIIHENRFTYAKKGLMKIADLGKYWEDLTKSPIPLGGIIARKKLGYDRINKLNRIMFRSVQYSMKYPDTAMPFVRQHAQEMDDTVMLQHIRLYVNDYTLSMGTRGKVALNFLVEVARERGII
ncbi:MAG: 1,4-dihydroxy-6-naphthoate synthase [Bacteroidales bacterium]|jgi:1,4-dihydroxy-6-naphthoate synthase|nr:1,4-dihydroxy-6-naphthoate synthase [Bacteroidales bacterium]